MQRKLILNFDINKTVIISDVGAGVSFDDMLNSLLSECVWGTIRTDTTKETRTAEDWILFSSVPTTSQPSIDNDIEPLVTFGDYLETYTKATKHERGVLKRNFTKPGGKGEIFRPYLEELRSAMMVDTSVVDVTRLSTIEYLNEGIYHIVPAFFELMIELDKRRWDFRIVFRTFGVDTDRVAHEYNLFCSGHHPLYPHVLMNGEAGTIDRRLIVPQFTGKLKRISNDPNSGLLFACVSDKNVSCSIYLCCLCHYQLYVDLNLGCIMATTMIYI